MILTCAPAMTPPDLRPAGLRPTGDLGRILISPGEYRVGASPRVQPGDWGVRAGWVRPDQRPPGPLVPWRTFPGWGRLAESLRLRPEVRDAEVRLRLRRREQGPQ